MEFDSSFLPVLIITLAAFFSSMVTAIVGAGGGTALLLLMLYMVPDGHVVGICPKTKHIATSIATNRA